MSSSIIDISTDFSAISDEEWKAIVEKDLKGKDFEETLVWKTANGFALAPYYRASDLTKIEKPERFRAATDDWTIQQDITVDAKANTTILAALERGANGLGLVVDASSNLSSALKDVYIDAITLEIRGDVNASIIDQLMQVAAEKEVPLSELTGAICFKPLTDSATNGKNVSIDALADIIKTYGHQLPNMKLIEVDATVVKNAGGNESQEIAFALAQANEYIDRLSAKGIEAKTIINQLGFKFAFGTSYFAEIAKVRAFRFLSTAMFQAYDVQNLPVISGITAAITYAHRDSYTNLLRATTAAMSAAVGGCSRITVLPHDIAFANRSAFADRIARNIQIVLQEEANMGKVMDAAGGAYYIEQLSDQLAQKSWELFQEIEAVGGYTLSLSQNIFQDRIQQQAAKTLDELKKSSKILVGVNKYQAAAISSEELKDLAEVKGTDYKAINQLRWSTLFEEEEEKL